MLTNLYPHFVAQSERESMLDLIGTLGTKLRTFGVLLAVVCGAQSRSHTRNVSKKQQG